MEEYKAVHGMHFTEELVRDAIYNRWSSLKVRKASEGQVYYNVTGATLGDMTFLANMGYREDGRKNPLRKRLKFVYSVIGNAGLEGFAFRIWALRYKDMDIDLRDYI